MSCRRAGSGAPLISTDAKLLTPSSPRRLSQAAKAAADPALAHRLPESDASSRPPAPVLEPEGKKVLSAAAQESTQRANLDHHRAAHSGGAVKPDVLAGVSDARLSGEARAARLAVARKVPAPEVQVARNTARSGWCR